jgi:hypothetical protein
MNAPVPPPAFAQPIAFARLVPDGPDDLDRAIAAVVRERLRQIEHHGHTREADDAAPVWPLLQLIRSDAVGAIESVQFNKGRPLLRRRLVRLGALVLAAIEKIDRETAREGVQG